MSQISQKNTCVRASFFIKNSFQDMCFPVKFGKFLRRTSANDCFCSGKFGYSFIKNDIFIFKNPIILKADSRIGWLIILKYFRVIFSLKKKTIQLPLSFNFYFQQKKSSKVVNLPLTDDMLCLSFWCHKQDKWLFQFSKLSWGSYVSL